MKLAVLVINHIFPEYAHCPHLSANDQWQLCTASSEKQGSVHSSVSVATFRHTHQIQKQKKTAKQIWQSLWHTATGTEGK